MSYIDKVWLKSLAYPSGEEGGKFLVQMISTCLRYTYTVSWRIRIFKCIGKVPRFFFSIQFNFELNIFNWFQFIFSQLEFNVTLNIFLSYYSL